MAGKILIAGASGMVGGAAVDYFSGLADWDVVAISRHPPSRAAAGVTHLPVDLTDAAACREAFGAMHDVTHVFYAAVNEDRGQLVAGWSDEHQIDRNARMLSNLFDPLIAAARAFRHITLIHGGKAYGVHLPGVKLPIPLREDLPRAPADNFYYHQHDYIAAKQAGQDWGWTIFRPTTVVGPAIGANMNPFLVLLVFAALRREAGLALPVPSGRSTLTDVTEARLIADASAWVAASPAAHNQIFNVNNGDLFSLHDMFPIVAAALDMPIGEGGPFDINAEIDRLAHLWPGMVRKYGLRAPESLEALLGSSRQLIGIWIADVPPGDETRWGLCCSMKLRLAGYQGCRDTRTMIPRIVEEYRALKIIP